MDQLDWKPTVTFTDLVDMMVDADLAAERAAAGQVLTAP